MIPEISEFSYGFALTNELVSWSTLKAAPIFPSLIEEGKKGGGYDVKLDFPGVPVYLQFKRAHCMTRRSAAEIGKHKANLHIPFYRFYITESGTSSQHEMLLELDDGTNVVFYAAPRFHRMHEINSAWQSNSVASQSIFVRPKAVGELDDKKHHVAYDRHATFLCSKPYPIECLSAHALADVLQQKLEADHRALSAKLPKLLELMGQAVERAEARLASRVSAATDMILYDEFGTRRLAARASAPTLPQIPSRKTESLSPEQQALRSLADKAQTLFDAQLVIVQKRD